MVCFRRVAPLVLSLALAACGSTVPVAQQQLAGAGSGLGVDGGIAPTGTGTDSGATTPGAIGGSAVSAGGTALSTAPGASGAPGRATTVGGSSATSALPGTTATDHSPVVVGFELIKGGNAAISAAFGTPVNFGDGKLEVTAIVEDLNARGGLHGHKIVPVFAEWDVTSKDPGRETTCRSLTEDGKATFLVTVINMAQSFVSCAAKHGVPVINASIAAGDLTIYQQYGDFLFSPSLMNLDRELRLVMESARSAGRLSTASKVGVVIDGVDDPQFQRVYNRTVDPTLTRWGIPHEGFTVAQQSDVSAAVLRFATDGVKTVLFVAPSGVIEVLFLQTAEQQQYRPDYEFGDSASAWFVSSASPQAQVQHIRGAGSLPLANVDTAQYPTTPREKACLDLIRKKGENNAERHSSITATVYCEGLYAFAAVAGKVDGPLTPAAFRAAYGRVGTSYQPLSTFRTDLANGRHDNAAAYRTLGYSDSCSCLTYTSGVLPLPA